MIPLKRHVNGEMPFHATGVGKISDDLEIFTKQQHEGNKIAADWWKASKWRAFAERLLEESHGKCGYCEEKLGLKTPETNRASVDHIRPKSKKEYQHLAYSYFNFVIACKKCNSSKSNSFEILGREIEQPIVKIKTSGKKSHVKAKGFSIDPKKLWAGWSSPLRIFDSSYQKMSAEEKREQPKLINPYFDQPNKFFGYKIVQLDKGNVVEIYSLSKDDKSIMRADYTIKTLQLNRLELAQSRFKEYKQFQRVFTRVESAKKSTFWKKKEKRRLKKKYLSADQRFSGMFRFFVDQKEALHKKGRTT